MKNRKSGWLAVLLLGAATLGAQTPSPADAVALEQRGKLPEAEQAWRGIVQQNPRDAGAFASLGLVLSKQGNYAQAATAYREALALSPSFAGSPAESRAGGIQAGAFCSRHRAARRRPGGGSAQPAGARAAGAQLLRRQAIFGRSQSTWSQSPSSTRPTQNCVRCWRKAVFLPSNTPAPRMSFARFCSRIQTLRQRIC